MKLNNIIKTISLIFSALIYSCQSHNHDHSHHETEEAHYGNSGNHDDEHTTELSEEQIKSIGIEYCTLEKKQLTSTLKANGILKVPNQNRANVSSLIGGIVQTIYVESGNLVNKGQRLVTIRDLSIVKMQEEYLELLSKGQLAELELKRQQELQKGNASAQKQLQHAETEYNIIKAKKFSAQKQLQLIGINTESLTAENIQSTIDIKSPIAGSVSHILINIGSRIDANNPVVEIIDNSQLHVDLFVYEKDLPYLKVGQTIHFTLTNNPGKEYDARIFSISNTFEEQTKAVAVHAMVQGNKLGLIDGMSITAIVSLSQANMNVVPNEAIVQHKGQDFIFIRSDSLLSNSIESKQNDRTFKAISFEKIAIKSGTSDVGFTEITLLKDIPTNAKIVSKGAFFILAKMTNQGEAHDH